MSRIEFVVVLHTVRLAMAAYVLTNEDERC
jgi:hypothetical protein